MQSKWKNGAANMRDNVIAHIIGMQNDLGNDIEDKGYMEDGRFSDFREGNV